MTLNDAGRLCYELILVGLEALREGAAKIEGLSMGERNDMRLPRLRTHRASSRLRNSSRRIRLRGEQIGARMPASFSWHRSAPLRPGVRVVADRRCGRHRRGRDQAGIDPVRPGEAAAKHAEREDRPSTGRYRTEPSQEDRRERYPQRPHARRKRARAEACNQTPCGWLKSRRPRKRMWMATRSRSSTRHGRWWSRASRQPRAQGVCRSADRGESTRCERRRGSPGGHANANARSPRVPCKLLRERRRLNGASSNHTA